MVDIENVWQELLPFIWTYIQELQQGAAYCFLLGLPLEIRGFKMLQMHSDGFVPVIDINITNQAVKSTSKPCLKEVEGVVYINCAHKSGGYCASDIEKHFQLTTISVPERCCAANLFWKCIGGSRSLGNAIPRQDEPILQKP